MTAKGKLVSNLLLFIVLLDQASKIIIDRTMSLHHSIPIIGNLFNLTYIRNPGAAFGIFTNSHEIFRIFFLIIFSLLAIGFILMMLRRLPDGENVL
ncbi:MAG: signal peptidase II, partial [Candidatus Binatia bacterium]